MTKDTITIFYSFIGKIISLLEEELENLESEKGKKGGIIIKKQVTEILNKLLHLIVQLNRLSKEENNDYELKEDDELIITEYLRKIQ